MSVRDAQRWSGKGVKQEMKPEKSESPKNFLTKSLTPSELFHKKSRISGF